MGLVWLSKDWRQCELATTEPNGHTSRQSVLGLLDRRFSYRMDGGPSERVLPSFLPQLWPSLRIRTVGITPNAPDKPNSNCNYVANLIWQHRNMGRAFVPFGA